MAQTHTQAIVHTERLDRLEIICFIIIQKLEPQLIELFDLISPCNLMSFIRINPRPYNISSVNRVVKLDTLTKCTGAQLTSVLSLELEIVEIESGGGSVPDRPQSHLGNGLFEGWQVPENYRNFAPRTPLRKVGLLVQAD